MPLNDEKPLDLSVLIRRVVRGTPDQVFKAWTEAEHIQKWWGPAHISCPQCEMDLRVGGAYRIANLLPDGSTIWIIGRFLKIERPHLLSYSWQSGSSPEHGDKAQEQVTVRFVSHGDKTEVIVEHRHIADEKTQTSHTNGWTGCLDGIEAYCS
ncbi:MAG: SRPBCC domain-containing protein [Hyphomicrobiales bacterium]